MSFSRKKLRESTTLNIVRQIEKEEMEKKLNESKIDIEPLIEFQQGYGQLKRTNEFRNLRSNARSMIKEHFLTEAVNYIYDACLIDELQKESTLEARRSVVVGFIKENTVDGILKTMNSTSLMLADIAKAVKESTDKVMKANEDKLTNPDTKLKDINIDPEYNDSFIDTLAKQKDEIEDIGALVQSHVANNVEDFIASNVENKQQIKDILDEVNDKVSNIKAANNDVAEEIKESMIMKAKRRINDIKRSSDNLLEAMVTHLSKRIISEGHSGFLTESNTIDIQSVVETAECMLTMMVLSEALGYELDEREVRSMYK